MRLLASKENEVLPLEVGTKIAMYHHCGEHQVTDDLDA